MSTPEDVVKEMIARAKATSTFEQISDSVLRPQFPDPIMSIDPIPKKGYGSKIVSVIAPVTEFLSRPQYASAAFFEGMMDTSKSIFDVISTSFNELIDPQKKLSYSDLIKQKAPQFAKDNPKVTSILGFLGDVALDPTTYLGVGLAGKGIKVGGKIVTEAGLAARNSIMRTMEGRQFIMTAIGDDVVKGLNRQGVGGLTREIAIQKQTQINFHRISEALEDLKEKEFKSLENVQRQLGKKGIVADINQLASPTFLLELKRKERFLTKEMLLEERKAIEPIINREFDIAAVNKELARKEVKGVVQEAVPSRVKKEIEFLRKEYEQQMAEFGISNIQKRGAGGKFGKKPSTEMALEELGISGVPTDFTKVLVRRLSFSEVFEKAEERMMRLTNADPKIAEKFFARPKLSLKIGLPFTSKFDKEVLTFTGLGPLKRSLDFIKALNNTVINKNIPIASPIARMLELTGTAAVGLKEITKGIFVRPRDEPFKSVITEFENQFDYIRGQVERETRKLFNGMTSDRRERINKVLRQIDDDTRRIEFVEDRTVTQVEADKIYADVMANTNFSPEEFSVIAGLKQEFANVAALEMDSSLLTTEIKNYFPRYYDSLNDAKDMTAITQVRYGLSTNLTSSQKRKYVTLQEAELAGHIPELDAAMIYAVRVSSSRRALVKKQFFEDLETAFNGQYKAITGNDLVIRNQNDLVKLLSLPNGKRYLDDIKLLGESVYPTGMNTSSKALLGFIDDLTGLFRKGATVVKPSFAPKQAISNTAQIMLEIGLKGAKTFDPRALADASLLLFDFYRGKKTSVLPKSISNLISRHFGGEGSDAVMASRVALENIIGEERLLDVANEFKRVTVFGKEFTGNDLLQMLRENNVIRGTDSVGNTFKKKIQDVLQYDPNNRFTVTQELAKYWKYPAIVEDYGRSVSYINFLTQGYSPKQAAQKVNEVLFDYQRGLTKIERDVIRRIIPFYTFPRFAVPFVMKKMMEQPGTIAAANKLTALMERLLVSEADTLNPSEREIFGDSFYVEQPRVFSGFDKEGKAKFNILNNMTPLDALSLLVYDSKTNEIDYERTVQKTVFAALVPYLKIPIEVAVDKNFFSGRTVSEGQRLGDYSWLPKFVKDAIGWEDRVSLSTGKTATYINTYMGYSTMQAIPALKQWLNIGDIDKSVLDKVMEIAVGVLPKGIDLKEMKEWQSLGDISRIRKIKGEIRNAKLRGATTDYEQNLEEYRNFLEVIKQGNIRKNEFEVRGKGILGQREEAERERQEQEQR